MSVPQSTLSGPTAKVERKWGFRLVLLALAAVAVWQVFDYGRRMGGFDRFDAADRESELRSEIDSLKKENSELNAQIALLNTSADIDKQAYAQIEESLTGLEIQIQDQQEELAFYRSIVAPADGKSGLRVQEFEITKNTKPGNFSVAMVVIRTKKHDSRVTGVVDLTIEGLRDGKIESLSLKDLGENDAATVPLEFKFRYFQDFQRDIVLPADFVPQKVHVELKPASRWIKPVSQSFDWPITNS